MLFTFLYRIIAISSPKRPVPAAISGIFSIMVFTYVVPPTGGLYLIRIVGTRPYGAVIQAYF
jgi:hypothetical protein